MYFDSQEEDAKLLAKTVLDVNLLTEDSWILVFKRGRNFLTRAFLDFGLLDSRVQGCAFSRPWSFVAYV